MVTFESWVISFQQGKALILNFYQAQLKNWDVKFDPRQVSFSSTATNAVTFCVELLETHMIEQYKVN